MALGIDAPRTPEANQRFFPATSPRAYSETVQSSSPQARQYHTNTEEIRPTETYLARSGNDTEQRTTTSSITTHSTTRLDAHVQRRQPQSQDNENGPTEDWESVSTNEVGGYFYAPRVVDPLPGSNTSSAGQKTLGQSIDQGIEFLMGGALRCAPTLRVKERASPSPSSSRSPAGSRSPSGRSLHKANSSVSGASTEIATNRAVDLALKRVQEIEKSRGTEQALWEARQALVRLKDTQTPPPSASPPPQVDVSLPIAAPQPPPPPAPARLETTKSILSDSTEESGGGSKTSSIQMLPVGRLDQKVNRRSPPQPYAEDAEHSLPNESLPSSIGVEVDTRGVTKSNSALRAVFEQHTLEALQRHREATAPVAPSSLHAASVLSPQHVVHADPVLNAAYNPPPPPLIPSINSDAPAHNEVRSYSMKTGRGRIVRSATTPPHVLRQYHIPSPVRESSPDPILCTGSYVSNEAATHDGADSSVVPTVVHPASLMMAPSHDSTSIASSPFPPIQTKPEPEELISPLTTHLPATEEEEEEDTAEERGVRRPMIRVPRRWPPVATSPGLRQDEQLAQDEEVANINRQAPKPYPTSSIRNSPAWASKERVLDRQNAGTPRSVARPPPGRLTPLSSPKPISALTPTGYSQSPARPSPRTVPTVSRIASLRKQLFEKPPRDNSLDSFVVRTDSQRVLGVPAIDDTSIDMQSVRSAFESRGSGDRQQEEDHDSDDDTASVKSLKEKYEETTSATPKRESGVSKYRAMFEAKSKLPSRPFENGTSELQEVFSKFQNKKGRPLSRSKPPRTLSDKGINTRDGIPSEKAEGAQDLRDITESSLTSDRLVEGGDCAVAKTPPPPPPPPPPRPQGSSVADRIKAFNSQAGRTPPVRHTKATPSPFGLVSAPPPTPKNLEQRLNMRFPKAKVVSPPVSDTRQSPRPSIPQAPNTTEYTRSQTAPNMDRVARPFRSSPVPIGYGADFKRKPRASPGPVEDGSRQMWAGSADATPIRKNDNETRLRASPATIEEARQALHSSPVSIRPESVTQRSIGYSDVTTDESQIEGELAAIAATNLGASGKSFDSPARKLEWFQRAAVEAGNMSLGDETSVGNGPVAPATPSRVQERIKMFAASKAVVSEVRRPIPTPAMFNMELRHDLPVKSENRGAAPGWDGAKKTSLPVQPNLFSDDKLAHPKPRRTLITSTSSQDTPLHDPPNIERAAGVANQESYARESSAQKSGQSVGASNASPEVEQRASSSANPSGTHKKVDDGAERARSESGSEFSDGVTLDMSIAEVSGLTLPTALHSRVGGGASVDTVVEGQEGHSDNSSSVNATLVEAKRSEASSSQTSEALIPLLNKALRQRPMSDERSMGDSFFEARAIVANQWSKTSEFGQQRSAPKEYWKKKEDFTGEWDAARIESSFPARPSNAGDLFQFDSEWVPFNGDQSGVDPFQSIDYSEEEKKLDDIASRSTTPTRSNRAKTVESYLDRRYPPPQNTALSSVNSSNVHSRETVYEQLVAPPPHLGTANSELPFTSFDVDPENTSAILRISSFESTDRLSRSHLAHHVAPKPSGTVERTEPASDLRCLSLIGDTPSRPGTKSSFFGRTHPQASDPSWQKNSYPSYDPTLPTNYTRKAEPQVPSWQPPASTANTTAVNRVGEAMQRYGAQHAALLARLRALKEARLRRANAIYARTTTTFPRRVEINDDYSMSTKSSTQFGGSLFQESLQVD